MSKPAIAFSFSNSPLATSGSTVVRPSAVRSLNAPDSNPSFLRPCYYLERPDGTRTALVEVDQLPELVRIRGLPPKLSVTDTAGMTSVGIKEGGHRKYTVEIADGSTDLHNGHTDLENASAAIKTPPSSNAPGDTMIVVNEGASTSTTTSADQGVVTSEPIPRKGEKVYCTYWIARGECHFAQQGCRFKHEMPDLDTLGVIMGRRSFPKWWLESIGPILAPPPHLRHAATNNRQQGKRRAITPKPLALPAPTNMHTNSNSAPTTPSIVSQAPTEGFSNMVKSPPSTLGSKFAARKDGGVDIGSHVSGASGGNMHSPVTGPSGSSNIRIPVSRPSGSNMRSSNSGPSGGNSRSSTGPSGSNARSSISGPKSNNSITQGNPPISGNSVTHGKQPVSDIRSPDDSCPSGSNMIQTKQPATNDGGFAISGAGSNTTIQTTKQSTNILTTSSPPAPQNSTSPLRIKIPLKYTPPFRVAVLPTLSSSLPSSSSSATPTVRPRVNLPLSRLQDIVSSSGFGNTNGDRNENIGAETTEGRLNDGGIAYTNTSTTTATTGDGGSSSRGSQMTRPYDDVFDLLGPF